MNETLMFRTVLRGYEPTQVHQRIRELTEAAKAGREQADHLRMRVTALEEAVSDAESRGSSRSGGAGDAAAKAEVEKLNGQLQSSRRELEQARAELQRQSVEASRLAAEADQARAAAREAQAELKTARNTVVDASMPSEASFDLLGARIAQILKLAEEEAKETRTSAQGDAESARQLAEQAANKTRSDADRYSQERRQAADADAARLLDEARSQADDMLDAAERDATARREEAEALYEQQRARAAQAAADFEMTLAQRRERAEQDFTGRTATAESQIAALMEQADAQRMENDRARADAERTVQRLIADAQQQAQELVAAAKSRADKIRAESERELVAAAQRRDSINAQLANVRQMLATLSGTSVNDDPFQAFVAQGLGGMNVDVTENENGAPKSHVENK